MLRSKTLIILKCLFLITFSRASAFHVIQFNDLNEDDLVSDVVDLVQKGKVHDSGNDIMNNIAVRGMELLDYFGSRRSKNGKKYLNKRLVKRIVPRGYEVNSFERDDKFQTIYKPLIRIHKNKPGFDDADNGIDKNKYELMLVLDDNQYKDDTKMITNLLNDELLLKPFAIDNMDIKYLSDNDIDYNIKRREKHSSSKNKKFKIYELLAENANNNAKNPLNEKFRYNGFKNPRQRNLELYSKRKLPLNKSKMLAQTRQFSSNVFKRGNDLDEVGNSKVIPDKLQWFGTVGHLLSKQFHGREKAQKETDTESKSKYSNKDIESADKYLSLLRKFIKIQKNTKPMKIKSQNKVSNFYSTPDKYGLTPVEMDSASDRSNLITKRSPYYIDQHYALLMKLMKIYNNHNEIPIAIERQNEVNNTGKFGRFGPVRQLQSKQFKRRDKKLTDSVTLQEKNNLFEAISYLIGRQIENERPNKFWNDKSTHDELKMYGPIGHMSAKHFKQRNRNIEIEKPRNSHRKPTKNEKLISQVAQLIAKYKIDKVKKSNMKIENYLQTSNEYNNLLSQLALFKIDKLFRPVRARKERNFDELQTSTKHNLLSQLAQLKADKLFSPIKGSKQRKDKNIDDLETSDKYLLSQLAQLKAKKLFGQVKDSIKQRKERIDDTKTSINNIWLSQLKAELSKERNLRTNQKSGEEDDASYKLPKSVTNIRETTTEEARAAVQDTPFWNYWTYQKSILQDHCKGNLIQLGNLCIRPQ